MSKEISDSTRNNHTDIYLYPWQKPKANVNYSNNATVTIKKEYPKLHSSNASKAEVETEVKKQEVKSEVKTREAGSNSSTVEIEESVFTAYTTDSYRQYIVSENSLVCNDENIIFVEQEFVSGVGNLINLNEEGVITLQGGYAYQICYTLQGYKKGSEINISYSIIPLVNDSEYNTSHSFKASNIVNRSIAYGLVSSSFFLYLDENSTLKFKVTMEESDLLFNGNINIHTIGVFE